MKTFRIKFISRQCNYFINGTFGIFRKLWLWMIHGWLLTDSIEVRNHLYFIPDKKYIYPNIYL